jgi:uncharacterized protein YgiM (DUF1202 family)
MPSLIIKAGGTYTMSGKYMKIKRVIIPTLTMVMISSMLFGCSSATKQDTYNMLQESTEIELEYAVPDYDNAEESKVELLPWLQLASLETHPELRSAFEELLGVTVSEDGTKTGIIYTDETGKANQNNTLFNALGSTNLFIDTIRDTEKSEKIESIASDNYTDIEDNQSIAAVINAYFELLPDQSEGQFDGDSTISRAQAMTLLMRAITPVNDQQAPETDSDFTAKVGETTYTDFAAPMNDYCYINTSNGLNEKSFESTMSRGEYIYMLTKALFGDEYSSRLEEAGKEETDVDSVTFTTLKDGGDVTYQEALNSTDKGLPTDMFNTFKKAAAIGFVTEDSLNWDEAITKSEAINLFIDAVEVYQTNTGSVNTEPEETNGNTAGDLYVPTEEDNQIEDEASQAIAEATKADEQLPVEKVADYTVTPMTATMYAQQAVNLRQGPGTNYDKTGSLSTNQSVEVTGYTDVASGKWYQLSNGSFVSSKYLSTDKVVIKTPTNNNSSNSGSNSNSDSNNSNSSGSSQSSSSSEGQTVDGSGSGDRSGSSRENRGPASDGSGGIGGEWNLQ